SRGKSAFDAADAVTFHLHPKRCSNFSDRLRDDLWAKEPVTRTTVVRQPMLDPKYQTWDLESEVMGLLCSPAYQDSAGLRANFWPQSKSTDYASCPRDSIGRRIQGTFGQRCFPDGADGCPAASLKRVGRNRKSGRTQKR